MKTSLFNTIAKRIKENFIVQDILLFGSYAKGNHTANSDIDLIVVLDEAGVSKSYTQIVQKRVAIAKILYDINYTIDLLVYTKEEWKKIKKMNSLFVQDILKNSISLV